MAYFWPISPILGQIKRCDSKKIPGQARGWKGKQTLFHRTFLATSGCPTSTTAVDWHLNVKDKEYDVSLAKNFCIPVSMQKISSIYRLIFKIQQVLGFNELNGHKHIMPTQKSLKQLLTFLHLFILEIQSVLKFHD